MLSKLKTNAAVEVSSRVNNLSGARSLLARTYLCTFLLAACVVTSAQAEEGTSYANSQDFQLHGFISQGLIDVNGSDFVNDDGGLSAELTEIGLNASYQLTNKFRLAAQVVYLDGGNRYSQGARVDYALLDWSAYTNESWQANVYFGRFKNNHWLYSSSRDIPFARPSIILPQSVYFDGFRDIAVGSDGIAAKLSHSTDEYGNFDWQLSYGSSPISDEQTNNILSEYAQGTAEQDYDAQASIYWQPAFSSWRFGLSLLDAEFTYEQGSHDSFFDADFTFQFYTINAIYAGEKWEFSGEIYQQRFTIDGFYSPDFQLDNIGQGFYLQSRYKLTQQLTLLARYEDFYLNKEDKDGKKLQQITGGAIPYYFAFHKDITLGVNYDITSNFSMRMEYHWVKGAGRLTPVVVPNAIINNTEDWQMWAVQLMYWF
ncbi:hypothetical protein CMT41_03500 [Colwellia sp. MT41]|uniref:TonB-dependent receptor n=1 Tax=Colwellia sp. MT41 TaxID=58049 RepID=UPI0007178B1F|nr:TonB-dependent receptor [Colwellia sp. MT41]ALO33894.1 hypothetical protein CMT41_03500 [Colwellia sp. MT41]